MILPTTSSCGRTIASVGLCPSARSRHRPKPTRSPSSPRRRPLARNSKPPAAKGPSQRQLRVGEMLRHALAGLLTRGEIHDDVLASSLVTVAEVRMSPDLKIATAYIMPLGGGDAAPVIAALERHKRFIRTNLAKAVNLKYAPDIRFREDEGFEEAMKIERLLASPQVRRDVENKEE
ncbi:MAG: 30S ribosome-binding factor RbfA [Alphaproteobacteria bacterium]|nr:30S ribosome-binding factor RbfA [Alphaproteobacteria bacterium]